MPELAGVGFTDLGSGVAGTHSAKFSSTTLAAWRAPLFERLAAHAAAAGPPAIVAFSGKRQFAELFPSKRAAPRKASSRERDGPNKRVALSPPARGLARSGDESEVGGSEGGSAVHRPSHVVADVTTVASPDADEESPPRISHPLEDDRDTAPSSPDHHSILFSEHRPASITPGRQRVLPSGWPLDRRACEVWVLPSTSGAAAMSREERWGPWRALAARLERA